MRDLTSRLFVAEMTIGRKLSQLEQLAIVKLTYGGAENPVSDSYKPAFKLAPLLSGYENLTISAHSFWNALVFRSDSNTHIIVAVPGFHQAPSVTVLLLCAFAEIAFSKSYELIAAGLEARSPTGDGGEKQ